MGKLTPKQIEALQVLVERRLSGAFKEANNWGNAFCMNDTMEHKKGTYTFYHDLAKFREKEGFEEGVLAKDLSGQSFDVEMKYYGDAFAIPEIEAKLDPESQWMKRAQAFGEAAARHLTQLIAYYIKNGTTIAHWDGDYYFGNSHPRGGTTYDNLLAGAMGSSGVATARIAMMRFPDDNGDAMGLIGDTLLLPPDLEYTAKELNNNTLLPTATYNTQNIYQGMFTNIFVEPTLTDSNDWYMFKLNAVEKPFLHLSLKGFEGLKITSNMWRASQDDIDFNHKFEFKAELIHTIAPTFPFLGLKMVN